MDTDQCFGTVVRSKTRLELISTRTA